MPKKPRTMIDETDLNIVRHLWDGRTPYAEIAEKLGLTTNTIRARVQQLQKTGVLQIIGLVDPQSIPGHSSAFVGFKIETPKIEEAFERIRVLKGVVVSACVSGRFDVMTTVMFNKEYTYRDFLFHEVPKVCGLISVETFFVVEAEAFNLRYVL